MFKKIIFLSLICLSLFAQIKKEFDPPRDSTKYYKLKMWNLGDNPGDLMLNQNWKDIDYILNSLIVYVDSTQFKIKNDTLVISMYAAGTDMFSGTATVDTIYGSFIKNTDIILVSISNPTFNSNDLLSAYAENGRIIVRRLSSSGTSNLKYNWIRIK